MIDFILFFLEAAFSNTDFVIKTFVVFLLMEIPYYLVIVTSILYTYFCYIKPVNDDYKPTVSVGITCYNEKRDVLLAIESLVNQDYEKMIEILVIVDGGSTVNPETVAAAREAELLFQNIENRKVIVIDKDARRGRVDSSNWGLFNCSGELYVLLDGDTSLTPQSIRHMVSRFSDSKVVGCSGNIKVRNSTVSLVTRLTSLEYKLGLIATRFGLTTVGLVNNISGAFGMFRVSTLRALGGWTNGSAEDLDLTTRLQIYKLKFVHESGATALTDSPPTISGLIKQRVRWSGDTYLIWIRRYLKYITPYDMGWKVFLFVVYSGIVFNIIIPLLILVYMITLLLFCSYLNIAVIGILTYSYYFIVTYINFAVYLSVVSDNKNECLQNIFYVLLLPIYAMILRINDGYAILKEIVTHNHLTSTMAPREVLLDASENFNFKKERLDLD